MKIWLKGLIYFELEKLRIKTSNYSDFKLDNS